MNSIKGGGGGVGSTQYKDLLGSGRGIADSEIIELSINSYIEIFESSD